MSEPTLPDLLQSEYGLYQLTEVSRTPESVVYKASNQWGNRKVEVEYANDHPDEAVAGAIEEQASSLERLRHPAVARMEGLGVVDGRVFVVREPVSGETLRDLVGTRLKWSNPFTGEEAAQLLRPLAEAADQFEREGCAGFLGRSLTPDTIVVRRQGADVSLQAAKTGPAPRHPDSPVNSREAIAELYGFMTGSPVDGAKIQGASTATGLLDALVPPAAPATIDWGIPAAAEPAPGSHAVETGPIQYFPDTDPDMARNQQWGTLPATGTYDTMEPDTAAAIAAPVQRKSRRGLALFTVLLLLLVAAAASGYWWWRKNEVGDAWRGGNANLARTFPDIISRGDGARGWESLPCSSQSADQDQKAKIRCADKNLGVTVAEYGDKGARDAALPQTDTRVVLQSGSCKVDQIELQGQNPPAYILAPEDTLDRYTITINGNNAADKLLYLPICK
ncbi:hypothetical protein [Corynebacterium sp. UBA2622]|uniref:hypothetical protein n=1 Tax=Corynebacterium sp. UBA2622 TaxID=1946393 RepID=UPI0025BC0730|nr:hypothetical protein [Corynebacterium sp. UBA2622]